VYLYSTYDDPRADDSLNRSSLLPTAPQGRKLDIQSTSSWSESDNGSNSEEDEGPSATWPLSPEDDDSSEENKEVHHSGDHAKVPLVLPRRRFAGACNVQTIKDGEWISFVENMITERGIQ
jgi:hypothetical protein